MAELFYNFISVVNLFKRNLSGKHLTTISMKNVTYSVDSWWELSENINNGNYDILIYHQILTMKGSLQDKKDVFYCLSPETWHW